MDKKTLTTEQTGRSGEHRVQECQHCLRLLCAESSMVVTDVAGNNNTANPGRYP